MAAKIFAGLVAVGLFGAGGYLYYHPISTERSCCGNKANQNGGVNAPCSSASSSCCSEPAASLTSETATDTLPMPREAATP